VRSGPFACQEQPATRWAEYRNVRPMKIKGDAGGAWTEFAVISDEGSVAAGVAEGLRTVRVRPTLPAPARIGVVEAGFCARVVTVAVVDGG
jgi:hypothetical protein